LLTHDPESSTAESDDDDERTPLPTIESQALPMLETRPLHIPTFALVLLEVPEPSFTVDVRKKSK
jgi:hypothetical protein